MKKFFYVAFMALTMGLFASCNSNGPDIGFKYAEDQNPVVDYQKGTVNGKEYDMETNKCWEITFSVKYPVVGVQTTTSYSWCTEFIVVMGMEDDVAGFNHQGFPAGYTYKETNIPDYNSCSEKNNQQGE